MTNENYSIAAIFLSIALAIAAIAFPITWYCIAIDRAAIQAGLVQQARPGSTGVIWVKP